MNGSEVRGFLIPRDACCTFDLVPFYVALWGGGGSPVPCNHRTDDATPLTLSVQQMTVTDQDSGNWNDTLSPNGHGCTAHHSCTSVMGLNRYGCCKLSSWHTEQYILVAFYSLLLGKRQQCSCCCRWMRHIQGGSCWVLYLWILLCRNTIGSQITITHCCGQMPATSSRKLTSCSAPNLKIA